MKFQHMIHKEYWWG